VVPGAGVEELAPDNHQDILTSKNDSSALLWLEHSIYGYMDTIILHNKSSLHKLPEIHIFNLKLFLPSQEI
jgi:hypothetical protein